MPLRTEVRSIESESMWSWIEGEHWWRRAAKIDVRIQYRRQGLILGR